jgi:bifunctional non-homologous end joining protein LigD
VTGGKCLRIGQHRVEVSHPSKLYFPADGITKGEVVDYYRRIAEVASVYYHDRPLTQQRFPEGIEEEGFFQKQIPPHFPDWIDRVTLAKTDGQITYVLANDEAVLAYLANQGCVTPHLALALAGKPNHPDRMILDLDPSDGDFEKVRGAAEDAGSFLEELGLPCFLMTTGSRGLHIVTPLDRSADFDRVRDFAQSLCRLLAKRHPDRLTCEQRKDRRGHRVFLDYLRNAYGQTSVAPYALRAKPGAPVATPLRWSELGRSDLTAQRFTLKTIFRRLGAMGDPWAGIAEEARSLKPAEKKLRELTGGS